LVFHFWKTRFPFIFDIGRIFRTGGTSVPQIRERVWHLGIGWHFAFAQCNLLFFNRFYYIWHFGIKKRRKEKEYTFFIIYISWEYPPSILANLPKPQEISSFTRGYIAHQQFAKHRQPCKSKSFIIIYLKDPFFFHANLPNIKISSVIQCVRLGTTNLPSDA